MLNGLVFVLAGGLFRRWWGGWLNPFPRILKLIFGFALAFAAGWMTLPSLLAAACFAVPVGLSFLNPFHAKYMRMGRDAGQINNPSPPLGECLFGTGLSYGAYSCTAAILAVMWSDNFAALLFAPAGVLIAPGYAVAWWLNEKFPHLFPLGKTGDAYFLDGPTALGEVCIGICMIGGLPLIMGLL